MMEPMKEAYCKEARKLGWNVLVSGYPDVLEWKEENSKLKVRFVELKEDVPGYHYYLSEKQIQMLCLLRKLKNAEIEVGVSIGDRNLLPIDKLEKNNFKIGLTKIMQRQEDEKDLIAMRFLVKLMALVDDIMDLENYSTPKRRCWRDFRWKYVKINSRIGWGFPEELSLEPIREPFWETRGRPSKKMF